MSTNQHKKLGLFMLTALVAGNMIGSGVFLLPSDLAKIGSISLYSWVFTAGGSILLALVFASLSRRFPKTGGPYAYARLGLGEFIGFQTAYQYWVGLWVGSAAQAVALVGYLRVFFPELADPVFSCFTAIAVVWILTAINIMGVRSAGAVQLVTTVLKLIPLLLVCVLGWDYIHPHYFSENFNITQPPQSNLSAISLGATLTLWAFIGLESATVPADSVHQPKRNIPIATIVGVLLAAAVYIVSSTTIMGMIPATTLQHSTSPFADAASVIFGHWGRVFIALGAIISCFGSLNGWVLLQGQVAMAASENQLFPTVFAKRNRHNVPGNALLITGVLMSAVLLLTMSSDLVHQFETIILMATLATLIPYLYTTIAAVVLDLKEEQLLRRHLYGRIVIAVLAGIFSCWTILSSGSKILELGAIVLISTVPLYAWQRQRRKKE